MRDEKRGDWRRVLAEISPSEEELERYGRRLLTLYERGYRVNIVQGSPRR
jgi:hypothetical protein